MATNKPNQEQEGADAMEAGWAEQERQGAARSGADGQTMDAAALERQLAAENAAVMERARQRNEEAGN